MYRFFTDRENIDTDNRTILIRGEDQNHIKNVLRMKKGEEVSVMATGDSREYRCAVRSYPDDAVDLELLFIKESDTELPCEVVIYQALPKADKMETVITKSVELGASRIVPVATKRSVVKLDEAKAAKKVERWNAISESAAKQSKRAIIPQVSQVLSLEEALSDCADCNVRIIPYELAGPDTAGDTRRLIESIEKGMKVAVFIGPEGGFTDEEIEAAKAANVVPVTLGRRILRTETAAMVALSWLIYTQEI